MNRMILALLLIASDVVFCAAESDRTSGQSETPPLHRPEAATQLRNKRDPFRSVIVPKKEPPKEAPPVARPRPPGLAGMLISEITLIGVASGQGARLAVLRGKTKASYLGKVGDRVYNGFIASIEADKVSFMEETVGPDGKKQQRTWTRKLYPET